MDCVTYKERRKKKKKKKLWCGIITLPAMDHTNYHSCFIT